MKIHLIHNQNFVTSFQNTTSEKDVKLSNENRKEKMKATVKLQIPVVSEVINQAGEPEYTGEERAFCKLVQKVLEEEEKDSVLKTTFTTTTGSTVGVRFEGKCLTRLLNECEKSVRIDLWAEMEGRDGDKVATFNYPDMPMSITDEDQVAFVGKLALLAPSIYKFEEGISYTGKICISLQVDTTPIEVMKSVPTRVLLPEGVECDFELISENGARIPCHRRFLSRNSTVLARMFETEWKDSKEKACNMNISEDGLNALLKFIYNASIDDPLRSPSIALELLETAYHYDISLLEKAVRKLLMKQSVSWYTTEMALKLHRFSLSVDGYRDLKWKAVKVIETKTGEVINSNEVNTLDNEDIDAEAKVLL